LRPLVPKRTPKRLPAPARESKASGREIYIELKQLFKITVRLN